MKQSSFDEVGSSHHDRVFLLGENRWEDPSRLIAKNELDRSNKIELGTTKCIACRGEGRLLCTGTEIPLLENGMFLTVAILMQEHPHLAD